MSFRSVRAAVVSAVLVSSLSACGDARTDLALARVCQGVRLGDPVRPTLVLFGTLGGLGGHWRYANRHDVCATFGAPDAIHHVARGRDVWFYLAGTRIEPWPQAVRAPVRFAHSAGTITFINGNAVSFRFRNTSSRREVIGG